MTKKTIKENNHLLQFLDIKFLYATLVLGVVLRCYRFLSPLIDSHAFRQTQTAGTVWLFHRLGFDPLNYHVVVFGGGFWVLEFPSYQTIAYFLTFIFGTYDFIGRIISIISYIAAAYILYLICNIILENKKLSIVSVFFFSLLPINIFYYRTYLIDPFVIALILAGVYFALKSSKNPSWVNLSAFLFFMLIGSLSKLSVAFAFGLPLAWIVWNMLISKSITISKKVYLLAGCLAILVLNKLWMDHSDALSSLSTGLTLLQSKDWYLGTSLVDKAFYVNLFKRVGANIAIIALPIALGIYYLKKFVKTEYYIFFILWLLCNVLYLFVFTKLNEVHDYYQLPIYVGLSILAAIGTYQIIEWINIKYKKQINLFTFVLLGIFLLYFLVVLFLTYYSPKKIDMRMIEASHAIEQHTPDVPVLVLQDGDENDSTYLYYAKRIGYSVSFGNQTKVMQLLNKGERYLAVIHSDKSPNPAYIANLGLQKYYEDSVVTLYQK